MNNYALDKAGIAEASTPTKLVAMTKARAKYFDEYDNELTDPRFMQQVVVSAPPMVTLSGTTIDHTTLPTDGIVLPIDTGDSQTIVLSLYAFSYSTLSWPTDFTSLTIVPYAVPSPFSDIDEAIAILDPIVITAADKWLPVGSATNIRRYPAFCVDTKGFQFIGFGGAVLTGNVNLAIGVDLYAC